MFSELSRLISCGHNHIFKRVMQAIIPSAQFNQIEHGFEDAVLPWELDRENRILSFDEDDIAFIIYMAFGYTEEYTMNEATVSVLVSVLRSCPYEFTEGVKERIIEGLDGCKPPANIQCDMLMFITHCADSHTSRSNDS